LEVLMALTMDGAVFWVIKPRSSEGGNVSEEHIASIFEVEE
jgi:hypothetical protein